MARPRHGIRLRFQLGAVSALTLGAGAILGLRNATASRNWTKLVACDGLGLVQRLDQFWEQLGLERATLNEWRFWLIVR
jgi:hypothetical protein